MKRHDRVILALPVITTTGKKKKRHFASCLFFILPGFWKKSFMLITDLALKLQKWQKPEKKSKQPTSAH